MKTCFDRFCLAAGIEALGEMMEKGAGQACGARHSRAETRRGYRWGCTRGKIGFHAGKIDVERPRVRDFAGRELVLPSCASQQNTPAYVGSGLIKNLSIT
jgi:putative transposase